MKVAVLGAGAWGTALAKVLVEKDQETVLWGHRREQLDAIGATHRNERYLPGVLLPKGLVCDPDLERAMDQSQFAVVAVPSKGFRELSQRLTAFEGTLVSVTKGIEYESGLTMCGVLAETVIGAGHVAFSGPTFAIEVARGMPTAIVAASRSAEHAQRVQQLFHRANFRVYTSTDLPGVELGGALKNVVALAAGVCDGLGFGDNSKAALITRGIVEMQRLGVACGAQTETFAGLSGLGDLAATCYSRHSRNRAFGERLGSGGKLSDVLATTASLPEGYPTARSAYQLAAKLKVPTPIIDEVYALLYEGKNAAEAVRDLTRRESKAEIW